MEANLIRSQTSVRVRLPPRRYQSDGPQLKDKVWIYFQKSQVSGGCGVKDVNLFEDTSGLWMIVTFNKQSGVQEVLQKDQHELEIDGVPTLLEVHAHTLSGRHSSPVDPPSQHDPEDDSSNSEDEDDEPVVEVTGFKPTTADEMLKLYFENHRKSGGGDIKSFEHDTKTGAIILTFENPSDARSVTNRSHRVDGAALSARLIVRKPRHRPIKKRCLFLSGIPDGCTSELVELFVQFRSGMDEVKIQYGEVPGTALCTFTEDIQDLENVIERVYSKKLQGAHVTAEKVHESDCILVQGVSPTLSLEVIELYFDNKRKSGGTGVRDVQHGPTDTRAFVYFEDWKVIGNILSQRGTHNIAGSELLVEEYHEGLGRLSPLDVPTPHVPKPVTVQVTEPIMEFIFGKGQHTKKTLIQKLRDVKAILKWPDAGDKTRAKLEPLLVDGQRQSNWLKWSETATQVLTDFINRCKSSRIPVPPRFWKDVMNKINQFGRRSFSIQPDAGTHLVTLVGEQQDVDKGHADIDKIIEELTVKAQYKVQQIKEDITLKEELSQPFIICGIKDKLEQDFPNLKITVMSLPDRTKLVFEESRKIVQEAELSMWRQLDNLDKVELKMGCNKVKFVRIVTDKIHDNLRSRGIRAACSVSDDDKIAIFGVTRKDAVEAKAYIDQEMDDDTIPIKNQAELSVLKGQEGRDLFDETNKQKLTVVNINQNEDILELCGFKTSLEEVKGNILSFMKSNVIIKEFVEMSKSKMEVLLQRYVKFLDSLAEQQKHNHLKIIPESGSKTGFSIEGNQEGLMIGHLFVDSLAEGIEELSLPSSNESDEHLEELLWQEGEMKDPKGAEKGSSLLRSSASINHPSSEEDFPAEEEKEEEEQFVEVTGFKKSSSEEILKMHFENPRRSGGGEIKTWEHDPKNGVIRMTFEDPSIASEVTAKQHKMGGYILKVKKIVKKKPRPRPVKKRCLFLSGIPDGCSPELVELFIENRSGMDEFKIQYGEVPGTALCTFTEDMPDLDTVIAKISSNKLSGVHLTAEKVREADCILVQGVSAKANLDLIELYFDNRKKSGGSGVREVQQGPTDTQAIVYFEDWKVVGDVLSKTGVHKIAGDELSAEEYHQCLGRLSLTRAASSTSKSTPSKGAKNVEHSGQKVAKSTSQGDITEQSVQHSGTFAANSDFWMIFNKQGIDVRRKKHSAADEWPTAGKILPKVKTFREAQAVDDERDACPICMAEKIIDKVVLECKHRFCRACIDRALKTSYRCPVCNAMCGQPKSNQPKGTMTHTVENYWHLSGYEIDVRRKKHSAADEWPTAGKILPKVKTFREAQAVDDERDECPICLADKMIDEVVLRCKHRFCRACIDRALKTSYRCPVCNAVCGQPKGNQPKGTMSWTFEKFLHLSGYDKDGVIIIYYEIPGGIQSADHPHPGKYFTGATITAYLPDNQEGREVLGLLRKAFDAGLVFTVGTSVTSGWGKNMVTWNDIHHKTSMAGGPQNYGYPDPGYLKRVKEDLAAKGIQ